MPQATWHEFGANFATLGHYIHASFAAKRRLQFSDIDSVDIASDFHPEHRERVWTDGSVVHADKFWITNAALAILDEQRNVRHQGIVRHWNVSAYIAEFWAIIIACAKASFPTTIFCDCKSVVDQAQKIFREANPLVTGHAIHGGAFCNTWLNFAKRFVLHQIPAHCFEGIPVELLTVELAASRQTTLEHILQNRLVGAAAKDLANNTAVVVSEVQIQATSALRRHQNWLIDLHELLPTHQPDRMIEHEQANNQEEATLASCLETKHSTSSSAP